MSLGLNVEFTFELGVLRTQEVTAAWSSILGSASDDVGALIDFRNARGQKFERKIVLKDMAEVIGEDQTFAATSSREGHSLSWSTYERKYNHGCAGGFAPSILRALIEWAIVQPKLICACFEDRDYGLKEDTVDIEYYRQRFGDPSGLPTRHNGLPYPLDRLEIDTSKNPGRRLFCEKYIEAVSAEMWLGSEFWARTGAEKSAVLAAAKWLKRVETLPNGVIYLQGQDKPFTSSQGKEGELQVRLRALLFPKSAESA